VTKERKDMFQKEK